MAERARDVQDVRDRLVAELTGRPAPGVPARDEPFVLAAVDLAPADTATLDPAVCVGLVTAQGGPTSHTAILAKALGLPAVVAAPGVLDIAEGTTVLVDGSAGTVLLNPDPDTIERVKAASSIELTFDGEGATSDGHLVQLLANVGDGKDVAAAVAANAQGVGLFRTEFCFLDRPEAPSITEQVTMYREVLAGFPGKKVVVRTLDAGADKPLPFLTNMEEENPALGVRGYRTALRSPEVLDGQLAAIAQAAAAEEADVWVMAPMVSTVDEAKTFVAQCAEHNLTMAGVMIETPAAAVTADHVLEHARFASLGTNDLGQYTMAADRLMGELAGAERPVAAGCAAHGQGQRGRRRHERPSGRGLRGGRVRPRAGGGSRGHRGDQPVDDPPVDRRSLSGAGAHLAAGVPPAGQGRARRADGAGGPQRGACVPGCAGRAGTLGSRTTTPGRRGGWGLSSTAAADAAAVRPRRRRGRWPAGLRGRRAHPRTPRRLRRG